MIEEFLRNLRVLWRAESILGEIRLRHVARQSGLAAFAGLIAVFGLLMLNVAGFFALEEIWGPIWGAVGVSFVDFGIGLGFYIAAMRLRPGRELDLAHELRDHAVRAVDMNAQAAQAELARLREEVGAMRDGVAALVRNPLEALLPSLVVPLAGALVKHLRKQDKAPAE